jgi:copper chaperone CopZ
MMKDTPRVFVGRANFRIDDLRSCECVDVLTHEVLGIPGVTQVVADAAAGSVTVVVDHPVDRAEIAAAVRKAGHRLRTC